MKKNTVFRATRRVAGVLAVLLTFGVVLAACSKKDSGGGGGSSGGSSGGGTASVPSVGKAAPASDFSYDATEDGKGVAIKGYTGKGGKVVIPAEIEGLPVVYVEGIVGETKTSYEPGYEITSVVFPASVKEVWGFNGIPNLTSVSFLGSPVTIGQWCFQDLPELVEIVFPDGEKPLMPHPNYSYNNSFEESKKLPLATRSKLKAMGFTSF